MYHYEAAPAAFRVDFVTPNQTAAQLKNLYFCDTLNILVSATELAEEIDSYYCTGFASHCCTARFQGELDSRVNETPRKFPLLTRTCLPMPGC